MSWSDKSFLLDDHDDETKRQKTISRKKEFILHFNIYLLMWFFFFVINVFTSLNNVWFYWPMLFWSLGIVIQYFQLFGITGIIDPVDEDWERYEMEAELRKIKAAKGESFVAEKPRDKLDLKTLDPLKQKETRWDENELV